MLRIETKPCVTVTTHKATIDLDKSYEVSIDKVVTTEGHTYVIHSELEGIEKLSLIHISEPTRPCGTSRMPSSG